MFSKLVALAGCVALATGNRTHANASVVVPSLAPPPPPASPAPSKSATVDVTVEESMDVWDAFADNEYMTGSLDSVSGRVDSMEALGDAVGSAITVAQSSTTRLDDLVAEIAGLKAKLAKNVDGAKSTFQNSGQKKHIKMVRQHAQNTANALDSGAVKGIGAVMEASVKSAVLVEKAVAAAKVARDAALLGLDDLVADAIEQTRHDTVFTGTPQHIKQVTGIDYKDTKSYLVWAKTSQATSSYVRGRKFYKVKFNLKTPGYWTSGSDELFMACRALSMQMFEADNIERDLVPPCNHFNHNNVGGNGQCFWVEQSYFSHCGGGGYWAWQVACGGIEEKDLRGIAGYEATHHNYDQHLCHGNGANNQNWGLPYTAQEACQYTLCTSQNSNFKR